MLKLASVSLFAVSVLLLSEYIRKMRISRAGFQFSCRFSFSFIMDHFIKLEFCLLALKNTVVISMVCYESTCNFICTYMHGDKVEKVNINSVLKWLVMENVL